ncbi:tRNA (adenosine(37)-N6)-threonylcarbamoyltransferase complex ATPase subunit type 1 TsaE [bacterium]|nr:tRNA (adenosine(37)-N6)-threonylcarbamoyltransferase complex ATPase subunit type 1 TsaE [bacterium]
MRISEFEFRARSAEETISAGERLAAYLEAGDVLCLKGDLGAGKTTFVKGIIRALQGKDTLFLGSPTYTLIQEYRFKRPYVFHFDFYRLKSAGEIWNIGWEEYCGSDGVCVVEWADLFPELIPAGACWLEFSKRGEAVLKRGL